MFTETKRIPRSALEGTLVIAKHPSGSSDIAVLERYFKPLCEGRLEPEAVIFYGKLLEKTDVRYIPDFVEALRKLVDNDPALEKHIKFRFGASIHELQHTCRDIRRAAQAASDEVGKQLREHLGVSEQLPENLMMLLAKLDVQRS